MTIKKGKLRGYESCGMLCSGVELGLTEDLYPGAGYNGLLVLPEDAELGADVKELTGLDDWIFDISLTANSPDCQSILGIAREVSAMLERDGCGKRRLLCPRGSSGTLPALQRSLRI